jgi:hypothetical protein
LSVERWSLGKIDARLLADALAGYSEVFTRANAVLNGELSHAAVLVQSEFKHGSFIAGLELVQNLTQETTALITASYHFLSAGAIAALVGFAPTEFAKELAKDLAKETVVGLFKWLRGKKPDEVKASGDDNIEVRSGRETKVVNINVFNLYGDSAIRAGLDKLTRPLRQADIERIDVKSGNTEQTVVEKSEAEYFVAEPLTLKSDSEPMEGEREAVLVVSKLSFKEGSSWTFFERGSTVIAKIEDEEFWKKVHLHQLTFGEGDLLRVRLSWEIRERRHQLKQTNTIFKVIEKLERPKQMRLDGHKDDEDILKQGRKFR